MHYNLRGREHVTILSLVFFNFFPPLQPSSGFIFLLDLQLPAGQLTHLFLSS